MMKKNLKVKFDIQNYLNFDPYNLDNKEKLFFKLIKDLENWHYSNCSEFKNLKNLIKLGSKKKLQSLFYLPISIFKEIDLMSVKKKEISKIMFSSGTSGKRSKIFLDRMNSLNQTKVLRKLFSRNFGSDRIPMLIVEKNPKDILKFEGFSAKVAAITGFSIFGKDITYIINDKNSIDKVKLQKFLEKNYKKPFLIFGFTSSIYENFIQNKINFLNKNFFKNGIILHGGGWKKLEIKKISNNLFKKAIKEEYSIKKVINYYGLIEQTGSIFFECENCNSFLVSSYSDVLIRNKNLSLSKNHEKGLVQLLSVLPTSYPGYNILTEDLGMIDNTRHKDCNFKDTKHFKIFGRIEKSDLRGCSDV
jgi:hypothetical protein